MISASEASKITNHHAKQTIESLHSRIIEAAQQKRNWITVSVNYHDWSKHSEVLTAAGYTIAGHGNGETAVVSWGFYDR